VSEACDGALKPVTAVTLMTRPAECKTAGAMTTVSGAADFWGSYFWASPRESSPEQQKD